VNDLKPSRPMVMIDEVPWPEVNAPDELALRCNGPECRNYETWLRRTLYQWRHFRVDMVVEPFVNVGKAIHGMDIGPKVEEQIAVVDPNSWIVGHSYTNLFQTEDDIEKIQPPNVSHDEAETARRLAVAHELFDGLLEVRAAGATPGANLWDPITCWMSVEDVCWGLTDRPDYMHRLVGRLADARMSLYDQLEEQNLIGPPQRVLHCTGGWTGDLPAPGYDPERPRLKDLWGRGAAQMFSSVSPRMFKEFELDYVNPLYERFGLAYYGCCEPLDDRMREVRTIPNLRKVTMTPWVNQERGAEAVRGDYVYARKVSPALVAWDVFNPEAVRDDLVATRKACEKYGCPLEYTLKDISTIRYEPERLTEFARIAMDVVGA